jgi:hypothetical protein
MISASRDSPGGWPEIKHGKFHSRYPVTAEMWTPHLLRDSVSAIYSTAVLDIPVKCVSLLVYTQNYRDITYTAQAFAVSDFKLTRLKFSIHHEKMLWIFTVKQMYFLSFSSRIICYNFKYKGLFFFNGKKL